MPLSKPSHRMTPFICLWTRNGHRANLTMSTWLPVRISFFASTMDGWKNIFHRFRNNHLIHTFISDQRISVVLFQCSKSYIKLFAWNNQFTIDFLFAGLIYISSLFSSLFSIVFLFNMSHFECKNLYVINVTFYHKNVIISSI